MQYTVGKDMMRSTSWPNLIEKVYNLQGQNIGQTSEKTAFSASIMHAKPQFRIYMMHDIAALQRARSNADIAIAVPLVFFLS